MICGVCGGSGFADFIVTCSVCGKTTEHIFCMRKMLLYKPTIWHCEECIALEDRDAQLPNDVTAEDCSSTADESKTSHGRKFAQNLKVYSRTKKRSIADIYHRSFSKHLEVSESTADGNEYIEQTPYVRSCGISPSKTESRNGYAAEKAFDDSDKNIAANLQTRNDSSASQPLALPLDTCRILSGCPISAKCWQVTFNLSATNFHGCFEVQAHFPFQVSQKVVEIFKKMDANLKLNVLPHSVVLPKIFREEPIIHENVALYFVPSESDRSRENYAHLMDYINKNDFALQTRIDNVELTIFASKLLSRDSARMYLSGWTYLWGVFRKRKKSPIPATENLALEAKFLQHEGLSSRANKKFDALTPVSQSSTKLCSNPRDLLEENPHYMRPKEEDLPDVPPGFARLPASGCIRANGEIVPNVPPGFARLPALSRIRPKDEDLPDVPPGFARLPTPDYCNNL